MKRRGNGEGTIRQRADGRWEGRFTERLADGTAKSHSVYGKTRREAQVLLREAQARQDAGLAALTSADTLAAYLDAWLEHVKANREYMTHRVYEQQTRNHIVPALGATRLDRLTPSQIQRWLGVLQRTLSPRTVTLIRTVLVTALTHAERLELVDRNVATKTKGPTIPLARHAAITTDEARAILKAVEGHRLEAAFQLGLLLGLRRGEIFGLTWEAIDWKNSTIVVNRQIQRQAGEWVLKPTKGKRGRTLALPGLIADTLRDRPLREALDRALAGVRWQRDDPVRLVFRSTIGTPVNGSKALAQFRGCLAKANLPPQRLHDLRHNCATLLFNSGVPARTVQEILGHANIGVTMNTYTHVLEGTTRAALEGLEEQLRDDHTDE